MKAMTELLEQLASKGVKLSSEAGRLNCYAPKGTLTSDVRAGILKYKAELIDLLDGRGKKPQADTGEGVVGKVLEFPLSAGEKGLYILQKLRPGMSAYNVPLCFKINPAISAEVLAKVWDYVLEQFPILTARVIEKDGQLFHRLDGECKTTIRHQAVEFADDQQLLSYLRARSKEPFDLDRGPLTRIELFTQDQRKSVLLLTIHHLVFDGTSAMILLQSFLTFYQQLRDGKPVRLSQAQGGYQEFVAWEEAMLASAEGAAHASYWQRQLDGELPVFELLADLPRLTSSVSEGKTLVERLPEELCRWVHEFSRAHAVPPSVIFLAFFQLLLHRYTNQDDIVVGMPVMGRVAGKFAADVGYFINMVPLRTRCGERLTLQELVRNVQGTMLDAIYHSSYPFPLMLDKLKSRSVDKNPVFQVSYAYQNFVNPAHSSSLLHQEMLEIENVDGIHQEGETDFGLEVFEDQGLFDVHFKYTSGLYAEDTIRRLFERYCGLLRAGSKSSDLCLHEYPMLTEDEAPKLLIEFNATRAEYPKDKCVHELIAEQATIRPDKTAVVVGDGELSYRELHDKGHDLALYLQSKGVKPDSLVCICMERSLEMVVGQLGVLQAGGAYVPLDPDYPDERLAYMLRDSGAALVLTDRKLKRRVSTLLAQDSRLVTLDDDWPSVTECAADLRAKNVKLGREAKPHHLAYVIYTSGSTGQPKGVMVEHRNLANLVEWHRTAFGLTESDISTSIAGVGFDAAAWEIWPALCVGATLASPAADVLRDPEALLKWWGTLRIDVSFLPTPLAEFAFSRGIANPHLRILLVGGDRLHQLPLQPEPFLLVNNYGPTECTVVATSGALQTPSEVLHIGRPISNTQVYILDAHQQPVPIGVAGEIYIGGAGVARGYLNRPELTAERFLSDSFSRDAGARMYRTGDLARWLDDGNIQYLGRIDTQVKIRGFRIELGEIEARLNQHPKILDSAVIAQGQGVDKQLVAFYRAKATIADQVVELPNEELRAHLLRTLPDYMVPAAFVSLPAIPLNPNGKVDRRALARMDVTIGSGRDYLAPRNDTETQLVGIWAEILKLAPQTIGVNDNFFELGGHSLLATQLLSKIRGQLDIDLPLKAVFEGGSIAQLAQLIAKSEKSDLPPIRPIDRAQFKRLPLSFAQERLWFLNELEPDSASYNVPGAVTISGELDINRLEEAFNLIIARHENLRTVFPSHEGRAHQQILDHVDFKLERIDLSHYATNARDKEARELCQADVAAPFDLANGPLLRGKVIKLAEHEHILMLNMHHIISDGWSLGVLIKERSMIMEAFRQGRHPELPPLPIQYADYSVWQRKWLEEGGILEQQLAYWKEKLAGVPENLDLATDYPRPSVQTSAGAAHAFSFDAQLTGRLKRLAEHQGGTLYMVLLAAFKALLYRYTGQNDLCVGSPIANRQYGETEGLIGMFVNTLALRSQVEGKDSFTALLSKVKATCLEAYEHQDAPFEKVIDSLRLQRNLTISPLFQVMVILQNTEREAVDPSIQLYPLDSGIAKFDLTVEFTETGDKLAGSIGYRTALYKPQSIARMVEHFTAICQAITVTPTAEIRDLDYLGDAEQHTLLVDFNDTRADYPKEACLHQLFVEQVALHGQNIAVVCGDEHLTYRQLHARSRDLALYLQSRGVQPDSLVGVCMERSLDMVVSLLGILQAGGAYVPLDPAYPDERLAYMVRDSRATIVLTQETLLYKLNALIPAETELIALDRQWPEIGDRVAGLKAANVLLQQQVRPQHLAYVIYTSGSTGQPKGVAIEHHSPVTLVNWAREVYSQEELAGVLASTSICFDLSVYEIFLPLASGGTIILVPNALGLLQLANRESITLINTVPSAMEELVRLGAIPDSVQTINLAGEPLSPRLVDKIYDTSPVKKVYDLYGPSEDTTYSTYILRKKNGPQTIGRPIANTRIYILDRHNQIQPIGAPGELHIAGDGLARGYLNRPELTRETFVANPFQPGTRMYKTGDLARWLDNGTLEYLGRIDTQVKVRGFRIELREIEARLGQHPEIQDAVVVAQGQDANKQLIAFYRAKETASDQIVELPKEELRAHLLRTLPDYMVPAAFVGLPAIPLNPNGKVDRRALARMDVTIGSSREYLAPRNDTETRLVAIWAEVLKRAPETIGVHDNFFELGGHSLLATQLISKIRSQFDVDLPLRVLFERTSLAQLAQSIAKAEKNNIPPIRPVDRAQFERLPLSFAQERLWFINQLESDSAGYNVPGAVTISGELDIDHLNQAFNLIIARHDSLRTVFPSQEGQAHQQILDRVDFKLERIDLSQDDQEARDTHAKRICQTDAATPFDLANGPLLRGKVIKLAEHEHILMLNMHHIVSDGWSLGVLIKELSVIMDALRQGRSCELAALPIQYVDYSVWQRKWLEEGGILEQQLTYWKEKLAGVPENLDLAIDYPRPSVQTSAGATHAFSLDEQLTGRLKRLAEHQGGTLYMVLLAAFKILLYRYTGQTDLCVGSPIANRQYEETEGLIGMFVNTLALRSQVEGKDTFTALLSKVKATCLEAYEYQDAPFEKVIDSLRLQRNLAISPLFQVMVILQNTERGALDPSIQLYPLDSGIAKFDLTVEFTETADELAGSVRYRTALYKPQSIARMAEHFAAICQAITVTPTAEIQDLDYLGDTEKHTLLVDFNDTRADYPKEACIHQLFAEQVAIHPDKAAVVFGEHALTYQELYHKSHDLALYLRAQGVKPDRLVGLYMERSLDMVVGLMGILQAGGAYVPLDPDYPAERLQYMLEDAAPAIVLTQERLKASLPMTVAPVIALDSEWNVIGEQARTNLDERFMDVRPDNLAYVIYTSGSTGVPKGVMIRHGGVVNLWSALERAVYASHADWTRVSVNASFSFDSSVKQFVQLLSGRTLIIVPQDVRLDASALLRFISRHQIDVFDCTPSQLVALLSAGMFVSGQRIPKALLVGGEAVDSALWRTLSERSEVAFYNVYGPAECTVDTTVARMTAEEPIAHIGQPVANTQIYILDRHGQPVPIGVVGEIYIGGAGVARGYLNQPELTAERFIADLFSEVQQARLYKSGDLGRWRADGNIEYVGRNDQQVKLRGQRIELGEIETQLSKHPGVKEAVVIAREDEPGEKRLVAYVTTKGEALGADELRSHLLARVPQYMVPAAFVELEVLPLTPSRKVDRRALPKPEAQAYANKEYEPPQGEIEETLATIWRELLHVDRVGRNDDFFELGGHSLSAVQLMAKINRHFKQLLPLAVLFTSPSIATFAKLISSEEGPAFDILVPIQINGDAPPVFAVPGVGGNVLSLRPLSKALGVRQPLFGLQAVGLDGKTAPLSSVEQTARANIKALKTVQPKGPYRLLGHSYGGVVAYEMARILVEQGEDISTLILLDSVAPSAMQRNPARDEVGELYEACVALASLYDEDLKFDIERLRQSGNEENVRYIVGLLTERGLEADVDQFAAFYAVYRANRLCYATYTPPILSRALDVSLYRARQGHQEINLPPDYGWDQLLQSPIRTYDVEADHYSILVKAHIQELAGALMPAAALAAGTPGIRRKPAA